MAHTIDLDYLGGLPAWRIRVVSPGRFSDVNYRIDLRLMLMPSAALLGILLKLYDIPDQPYFVHRVVDLSDDKVREHVGLSAEQGKMVVVLEPAGAQDAVERTLTLAWYKWKRAMEESEIYHQSLTPDGQAALDCFLEVFKPVSEKDGVEAAWEAVARRYATADREFPIL